MAAAHEADELLLGFARALRAAGVPVTADRERTLLEAVAEVGMDDRAATYWAGRATLVPAGTHFGHGIGGMFRCARLEPFS